MLAVLRALRDQGYAAPGRPAVLRAFIDANNRHQHLVRAKAMLAATEFATIRDHVRFHALIDSDVHNAIKLTHSLGLHGAQSITAWDGSNAAGGGFLVTAVVGFNDLASGATGAIMAKSDSGGFALEQAGSDLRFGVYVAGSYRYASVPLSTFNSSDTYFIVGAYDGNGAVRLWANNTERGASAPVKGGVGLNHSPIVIGADPQGATERRFYFNGRIQQVMVQRWRDHAAPPAQGRRCALRLPACLLRD